MKPCFFVLALVGLSWIPQVGQTQDFTNLSADAMQMHAPWGLPLGEPWGALTVLERQGYIVAIDENEDGGQVPMWTCYQVNPEFLEKNVQREGPLAKFRTDPDLQNPVDDDDYDGLFSARGFARGHLAPWAVMGGDRNGNGKMASDDPFDQQTFFEANYMSNIAPQHHQGFNGPGGVWFKAERFVQDILVRQRGQTAWVACGCVFGVGEHETVGPQNDIWVPAMFYKIVAVKSDDDVPRVYAFLFPHHRAAHGDVQDYLVTVDVIEAVSGMDFFHELDDAAEDELEDMSTWRSWQEDQRRLPRFTSRGN